MFPVAMVRKRKRKVKIARFINLVFAMLAKKKNIEM
jgi:hypothetical protein